MIGKTTAVENAATHSIRRAVSRDGNGQGFAATLAQQRQKMDAGGVESASAPKTEPSSRVPIGHPAPVQDPSTTSRVPIGSRAQPATGGRQPVAPDRVEQNVKPTPEGEGRRNLSTADVAVTTMGTLSDDPRTDGMYVPPDFYHGTSYSPVFDTPDASGNMIPTPRFEGQKIYSDWRGSLPEDFDPNARVVRDPQAFENNPSFWQKNDDGTWTRRETGYGGIPLYENGKPVFTPDPLLYPEYFKV